MVEINYKMDSIYDNAAHLDVVVLGILNASILLFKSMRSVKEVDQLQRGLIKLKYLTGDAEKTFEIVKDLSPTIEEHLIDSLKLVFSLENFMNVCLLRNKFLAHKIRNIEEARYPELNKLRKKQKKEPISVFEYKNVLAKEGIKSNTWFGLTDQTIEINSLLSKQLYLDVLNIPKNIQDIAKKHSLKRNRLHLIWNMSYGIPNASDLDELFEYADFINTRIVDPENKRYEHNPFNYVTLNRILS